MGRIADETSIIPVAAARRIVEEIDQLLVDHPRRYAPNKNDLEEHLVIRAEECFAHNERFRRQLSSKGNEGRDLLLSFMRHWGAAWLKRNHPTHFEMIPSAFCNGEAPPQ